MSADGQCTKWCRNIAENFNRLSRAHERYSQTTDRRQTDGLPMTYSEREREFTFAKNYIIFVRSSIALLTTLLRFKQCMQVTIAMCNVCNSTLTS